MLEDLGKPNTAELQTFVNEAVDKIEGKPISATS